MLDHRRRFHVPDLCDLGFYGRAHQGQLTLTFIKMMGGSTRPFTNRPSCYREPNKMRTNRTFPVPVDLGLNPMPQAQGTVLFYHLFKLSPSFL